MRRRHFHAILSVGFVLPALIAAQERPAPPSSGLAPSLCQLPASTRTLGQSLDELTSQSGIAIDQSRADKARPCPVQFGPVPFWDALERTAAATRHRVSITQQAISLIPLGEGEPARQPPPSVSGPFRVTVREAIARRDFESGRNNYDLTLDVHWEPKVHVFLIGLKSQSLLAADAVGKTLDVTDALGGRLAARGTGAQLGVRLGGLTRQTAALGKLTGSLDVVGTQRYAEVVLPAKAPAEKQDDGVTIRLRKFKKLGNIWVAEIALQYPADTPEFESFQSWADENQIALYSPAGAKFSPDPGKEVLTEGRAGAVISYYFPADRLGLADGNLDGWTIRYRMPGRIVQTTVPFSFEKVELP